MYQFVIQILAKKDQFPKVTIKMQPYLKVNFQISNFSKICPKFFYWLRFFNFTNIKKLHLLICPLHTKDNKAVSNSGYGIFNIKWAVFSVFKKIVVCTSERDICYIFQNISRTKLILIHEIYVWFINKQQIILLHIREALRICYTKDEQLIKQKIPKKYSFVSALVYPLQHP